MGPNRLRFLNSQAGPVNTLASRRSPTQQSQKLYHGSGELSMRHRKQLVSPSSARDKPVDLIQDDDSFDVRSTSSAETRALSVNQTPRVKKSRLLSQPQIRKVDAKTAKRSRSPAPDSPDVLAVDEPPLTNIVSDITPLRKSSKRQVSSDFSDSRVKRSRPNPPVESIDESEDELQVTQHVKGESGGKRATNFTGMGNRQGSKIGLKGDILPSKFVGLKAKDSQKSDAPDMYLQNAVSGRTFWQAKAGEPAKLVANGTADSSESFSPSTDDRAIELDWLQIISSKLLKVQHAGSHSKYVHVSRNTALPAHRHLYLDFASVSDAVQFVTLLPENLGKDLTDPETLGKRFNRAMEEAIKHSTLNNRPTLLGTSTLSHKAKKREASVEHVERPTKQPQIEQVLAPKSQRLRDRMLPTAPTPTLPRENVEVLYQPSLGNATPTTRRRTRQSILNLDEHEDIKWTAQNSKWQDDWQTSLIFPATGKNRATVDAEDIARLDEGEFLNDNLISFYLRYLQAELEKTRPELLTKVHIFSSFFFEKLRSTKGKINYEGVRNWTAKIDLFSYDYIVVPVNEHAHWYLAIICNVGKTLPNAESDEVQAVEMGEFSVDKAEVSSTMPVVEEKVKLISLEDDPPISSSATQAEDEVVVSSPTINSPAITYSTAGKTRPRRSFGPSQKLNPKDPRIITLDSLGSAHAPTSKALREYIAEEARDKKSLELGFSLPGMTGKGIPEQDNFCDCGVFVLAYMEEFLKDPDETARKLLQKEPIDWAINPSSLRSKIRNLLFDLQKAQQIRLTQEKDAKRAAVWKKKQAELGRVKRSSESTTTTMPPRALVAKALPDGPLESADHNAPPDALPSQPQSDGPLKAAESEVSSKALASKAQSNGASDRTEPVTPSKAPSLDKPVSTRSTSPQLALEEANAMLNAGENHTDELPQLTPPRPTEKPGVTILPISEIKFVSPLKDNSSPCIQRRGSATSTSELAKRSARSETPRKKKKRSKNKKKKKKNEAVSSMQPVDKVSSSEPDSSEGEDKATSSIRPSIEADLDDEKERSTKEAQREENDSYLESAYFKPKTDTAGYTHASKPVYDGIDRDVGPSAARSD